MRYVVVEARDGCSRVRLCNGGSNVLTVDVVHELSRAFAEAAASSRAVMLCGGEKFFCNGLDLPWALARRPDELRDMFLALGSLVLQMLECPVPLVGAARGHAIGAGKTLFTACDYRFAASGRVLIGMPEILLGVPNPWFADQLIRHLVGDAVASDLVYSGRLVEAHRCVASGLVHQVNDAAAVEDEAWSRTVALAALPGAAFAESKAMRVEELCRRIRAGLAGRTERLLSIWFGRDAQERLQAAARRLDRKEARE